MSNKGFFSRLAEGNKVSVPDETMPTTQEQQKSFFERLSEQEKPVQKNESEGLLRSTARTVYAPVSGYLGMQTPNILASLWQMAGQGEALSALENELSPENIERLKKLHPEAPWDKFQGVDPKKYMEAVEAAGSVVPTVSNIESWIEKATGLPLTAKNNIQRYLRTLGGGVKLSGGGPLEKLQRGTTGAITQAGLETAGVPESLAEPLAYGAGTMSPAISKKPVLKPSGMPQRQFESLTKERAVSPKQHEKILKNIKKDVKETVDNLIKKESKTANMLESNPNLREEIKDTFEKVEGLAKELPNEGVNKSELRQKIEGRVEKSKSSRRGVTPSEAETVYEKEMEKLLDSIGKEGELTNTQLYEQYRKNNAELDKYFEPGKSRASNMGKKESLLEYNRAIADFWKEKYPDSEFNKLFEFSNKVQSQIYDLDLIDSFFDKVFKENKIDYNVARKGLENSRIQGAFKKTLGPQSYKNFNEVMREFMGTEKSMRLLKKAEFNGFKSLTKLTGKWLMSPTWAKLSAFKTLGQFARNNMLANRKFMFTWKSGLRAFKEGRFKKAEEQFQKLDNATEMFKKEGPKETGKESYETGQKLIDQFLEPSSSKK